VVVALFEKRTSPGWDRRFKEELKNEILAELSALPPAEPVHPREKDPRRTAPDWRKSRPYREGLKREIMREIYDLGPPPAWAGGRPVFRGRVKHLLASREGRGFGWGVGLTLAAVLLAPGARRYVRPAARKILEEVMEAAGRVQRYVTQAKEDLEDLVAEARFHQMEEAARETGTPDAPEA